MLSRLKKGVIVLAGALGSGAAILAAVGAAFVGGYVAWRVSRDN